MSSGGTLVMALFWVLYEIEGWNLLCMLVYTTCQQFFENPKYNISWVPFWILKLCKRIETFWTLWGQTAFAENINLNQEPKEGAIARVNWP